MTEYYIDGANGDNSNGGEGPNDPFKDFDGLPSISGGDQIFLVDGPIHQTSTVQFIGVDSTEGNETKITNYDGSNVLVDFDIGDDNGFEIFNSTWWVLENFRVRAAGRSNITLKDSGGGASNIVIDNIETFDAGQSGTLGHGMMVFGTNDAYVSDVTIKNCDCHHNTAATGNADGVHMAQGTRSCVMENVVMRYNADDGVDLLDADAENPHTLRDCIVHHSGLDDHNNEIDGGGGGFKLGRPTGTGGGHKLVRCLSYYNKRQGFNGNNHDTPLTLHNCAAWNCGQQGGGDLANNAGFRLTANGDVADELRNCWAYENEGGAVSQASDSVDIQFCSFTDDGENGYGVSDVSDDDFQTKDNSKENFLHLADGSDMIDAGTDVGLSYNGGAPDLGCHEFVEDTSDTNSPTVPLRVYTGTEWSSAPVQYFNGSEFVTLGS